MDFSRCQPPCSRLIASDNQRGKCVRCVGLAHAQDAIFGISNCKLLQEFYLNFTRLVVFDRESAVLPRRATPSLDAELEAIESEQISLSLPPSSGRHRANYLVQFSRSCLAPSLEAREAVSFGLEDILYTAASNSEEFGAASLDVEDQEAQPSPAYRLVDVLARTTEKLSLDWPDEPCESQSSKLDERFLGGSGLRLVRRKLPFFPDLHHKISRSWKQPFSSRLTNAASADFTNLVGSVERGYAAVPAIEDTLAKQFMPRRAHEPASISSSRERPALRKLRVGRVSDPVHQMETVRPLIVPGPFPLGSSTPPNVLILVLGSVNCPVGSVLEFLQDKFSAGAAATTLRVYSYRCSKGLGQCPAG